jgi:tetraacyldisaccharide 4'-kinase
MLRRLFSWLFILISKARLCLYKKEVFKSMKVDARVISVGNISMGGSGKTPMSLKLVNEAVKKGLKTVVIERGYKSELSPNQIICVEKGKDSIPDVKTIGDEATMVWESLHKGTRLCVSKSKSRGALFCTQKWKDTQVIVIDDGFQHLALDRDVNVVLIDAVSGFNDKVFPHGILREPYTSLKRANIVVFTKADDLSEEDIKELVDKAKTFNKDLKIFFARTKFYSSIDVNGKKVLPVSAVFNGFHFRKKLKTSGAVFEKYMEYSDHRKFSSKDMKDIYDFKDKTGAEYIALTKKDWAKLEKLMPNHDDVVLCWYEHSIDDEEDFLKCCIGA